MTEETSNQVFRIRATDTWIRGIRLTVFDKKFKDKREADSWVYAQNSKPDEDFTYENLGPVEEVSAPPEELEHYKRLVELTRAEVAAGKNNYNALIAKLSRLIPIPDIAEAMQSHETLVAYLKDRMK